MNRARNSAIVVGGVLVGLIALLAFGAPGRDNETAASQLLGRRVPAISGPTLDGGTYDIDLAAGRWVLINFFATWCAGCITEHPELVALDQWGATNGELELVSVVFDDQPENVAALFEKLGGTWPVLNAPSTAVDFQIRQVPESFLVNPDGVVVAHIISGITADQVIGQIEAS